MLAGPAGPGPWQKRSCAAGRSVRTGYQVRAWLHTRGFPLLSQAVRAGGGCSLACRIQQHL
eukprot:1673275-Alexandrium_andersonii.AAC.1